MLNSLSEEDRIKLAHVIMRILDTWRMEPNEQIQLLDLPDKTKPRALKRYRDGTPFPQETGLLKRAELLLSIDSALRTTFPHNPAMGGVWMSTPNRRFDNLTPLSLMLREGLEGIYKVQRHLDCTENWF